MEKIYIITKTNYWKSKSGNTTTYDWGFLSIQAAKEWLDERYKDDIDYTCRVWKEDSKGVDFDGAWVEYKIKTIQMYTS